MRKALLQQKQNKANEVISNIDQENKKSLIKKLNAVVMSDDILNNLFDNFELQNQVIKRGPGRPKNPRNPVGRPVGSKTLKNGLIL